MLRDLQGGVLRDLQGYLQRKWGASRLAEKVAGRVGRVRRVGQLFQEICNARSTLPLALQISMREAPCHHQANSKREAHNIMPFSSKKVLRVLRVLHVLLDISQREAPTRYPSFFPFPDERSCGAKRGRS